MSKSLLFDLKVLEFKLKESLKLYENTKIEENNKASTHTLT